MKRTTRPGQCKPANPKPIQKQTQEQLLMKHIENTYQAIFDAEPRLKHFTVEVRVTKKNEPTAFRNGHEEMLVGWEEIAEFLKLSEIGCQLILGKQLRETGAVFYKKVHKARNDQRRRYACSFPSSLIAWSIRESLKRNRAGRNKAILELLEKGKNGVGKVA